MYEEQIYPNTYIYCKELNGKPPVTGSTTKNGINFYIGKMDRLEFNSVLFIFNRQQI